MKTLLSSNKPSLQPYSAEDLEVSDDLKEKLEKLMKFFEEYNIDYSKFDPNTLPSIDFGKKDAYPNTEDFLHIPGQHNTQKWLQAISEIYRKEQQGENRVQAIRRVTSGWNIMETYDFLNWIKYHESGDHMKYKFAKLWYENDDLGPGYFLQIKKDNTPEPPPATTGQDIDFARERAVNENGKRETIEKQRNKIIGRLDSAEKLLRSPDGQVFSGKDFEPLIEAIYQLKKKIQLVNKISSSTRLYDDMIIREANILANKGFNKAASILASFAQTPAASGTKAEGTPDGTDIPAAASPGDPSGAGNPGAPGGLPSMGPGMPQNAPSSATPEGVENTPPAIEEFLAGLNKGQYSPKDNQGVEDDLEVSDSEEELLVTEAQVMPPNPNAVDEPITTSPSPAPLDPSPVAAPVLNKDKPPASPTSPDDPMGEPEELEVTEDDIESPALTVSNFNEKMNELLQGATIADAISELEDLDKIFKTREIPRRLGRVDMIFNALGITPFFPALSEATGKSLEANNYIATRIDDILSKLRGTLATKDVNLKGDNSVDKPEMSGVKNKLQQDDDKEKARKKMRKEQETMELENNNKETPEVEIEEDLAPPPPPPAAAPKPPAI